jgi:hypothetical protein
VLAAKAWVLAMNGVPIKVDWQWPAAAVYSIAFLTIGGLVALGKVNETALLALVTWLAPGPWQAKGAPPIGTTIVSDTHVEKTTAPPPATIPVTIDTGDGDG